MGVRFSCSPNYQVESQEYVELTGLLYNRGHMLSRADTKQITTALIIMSFLVLIYSIHKFRTAFRMFQYCSSMLPAELKFL